MVSADFDAPTFDYAKLRQTLEAAQDKPGLYDAVVNAPFEHRLETGLLFLGIIVLLLVDKKTGNIDRVALSNTELAKNTTKVSTIPFQDIRIPLEHQENIIATAIRSGEPQDTTDWRFLFVPALTPEQARLNQASGGIAYSAVYPLPGVKDGGALIFSYFQYMHKIGDAQRAFMEQYAALASEALETKK